MLERLISTFITPYIFYIKIAVVMLGITTAFVLYNKWKAHIAEVAIMEVTIANQKAIISAKENEIKALNITAEELNKLRAERDSEIELLKNTLDKAMEMVNNANDDREASKLLKETIEAIRKSRE